MISTENAEKKLPSGVEVVACFAVVIDLCFNYFM